jgi:hypothetical protein
MLTHVSRIPGDFKAKMALGRSSATEKPLQVSRGRSNPILDRAAPKGARALDQDAPLLRTPATSEADGAAELVLWICGWRYEAGPARLIRWCRRGLSLCHRFELTNGFTAEDQRDKGADCRDDENRTEEGAAAIFDGMPPTVLLALIECAFGVPFRIARAPREGSSTCGVESSV